MVQFIGDEGDVEEDDTRIDGEVDSFPLGQGLFSIGWLGNKRSKQGK